MNLNLLCQTTEVVSALSHGLVVPTPRLSLNEMVWLSSGFVIDVDYSPDFESSVDAIQN